MNCILKSKDVKNCKYYRGNLESGLAIRSAHTVFANHRHRGIPLLIGIQLHPFTISMAQVYAVQPLQLAYLLYTVPKKWRSNA